MRKEFLFWGLLFGILAIIFGAFGAHLLKPLLHVEQLNSFETGIRYQMYHALLLVLLSNFPLLAKRLVLILLVSGVFCFSFSIYLLNLRDLLDMPSLKVLGPVTPIGGLLLISSWAILLFSLRKIKNV